MSANVIDLAHSTLVDDQVNGLAVILHIQPVSDIQPLPVYRQRLICQCIGNHQRDQLFREMIRSIVVGAPTDGHRKSVGSIVRLNQQICRCFGAGIRRTGMDRRFFGEEEIRPVQGQVAIHLVRRHLMIPCNAILPAGIHQHSCAQNVGTQKDFRILNGAIHMALCRKIHNNARFLLFKECVYRITVADIRLYKAKVRLIHQRLQRRKIARIGQLVQTNQPVIRVLLCHMEQKVGANKAGTACYNDIHTLTVPFRFCPRTELLTLPSATVRRCSP